MLLELTVNLLLMDLACKLRIQIRTVLNDANAIAQCSEIYNDISSKFFFKTRILTQDDTQINLFKYRHKSCGIQRINRKRLI